MNNNGPIWNGLYMAKGEDQPWCMRPGKWFNDAVNTFFDKPSEAYDLACGTGNYSWELTQRGYKVTGIDISEKAISIADAKFGFHGIEFKQRDVLSLPDESTGAKDYIISISIGHHFSVEDRVRLAQVEHSLLKPGGKLITCSFSVNEPIFKGYEGKPFIETGTVIFPVSKQEIIDTYNGQFDIRSIEEIKFGKSSERLRYLAMMTRK